MSISCASFDPIQLKRASRVRARGASAAVADAG
jgi:hypothetical protein